jgi:hypothetical protein
MLLPVAPVLALQPHLQMAALARGLSPQAFQLVAPSSPGLKDQLAGLVSHPSVGPLIKSAMKSALKKVAKQVSPKFGELTVDAVYVGFELADLFRHLRSAPADVSQEGAKAKDLVFEACGAASSIEGILNDRPRFGDS